MWLLFGTTITTSFFDSLNPSAIAQQMLLQAMVKKKRHIWLFIFGIGFANLAMGLAVYYGIAAWVSRLAASIAKAYPIYVYGTAVGAGAICLLAGVRLAAQARLRNKAGNDNKKTEAAKAPVRLSPASLFIMGAAFCFVELTSAFPYFGFIALLTQYHLAFPLALLFMLLYNFMYILPLILLYFGYGRLQGTKAIQKLEAILGKVSSYIIPAVITLAGILLVYYGMSSLL